MARERLWLNWTTRDDATLTKLWHAEKPAAYIGAILQRTPGAVTERARTIGLPRRSASLRSVLAANSRTAKQARSAPASPAEVESDPLRLAAMRHANACLAEGGFPVLDIPGRRWIWPVRSDAA